MEATDGRAKQQNGPIKLKDKVYNTVTKPTMTKCWAVRRKTRPERTMSETK